MQKKITLLIIGEGGREHAIAWKCAQSSYCEKVWVAPGNAGTSLEVKVENINICADEPEKIVNFCQQNNIELVIIGPEAPLANGLGDLLTQHNIYCIGPSKAASQLESSKAFSKNFMQENNIPSANFKTFQKLDEALGYIAKQSFPLVLKADGLAAGKGVIIAHNIEQANAAAHHIMHSTTFADAGKTLVIEEFIEGVELSYIVLACGNNYIPLASSQDHKAAYNNDLGPNTGGMGAYSPSPWLSPSLESHIQKTIIEKTLHALSLKDIDYCGFLYAGLMLQDNGDIKVLEFNCRLGDPETQVILPRLQSDLVELLWNMVSNESIVDTPVWDPRYAVGVVLAAEGYPGAYPKNIPLTHLKNNGYNHNTNMDNKVFLANSYLKNHTIHSNSGRICCAVSLDDSIIKAQKKTYEIIDNIAEKQCYWRTDIGNKGRDFIQKHNKKL